MTQLHFLLLVICCSFSTFRTSTSGGNSFGYANALEEDVPNDSSTKSDSYHRHTSDGWAPGRSTDHTWGARRRTQTNWYTKYWDALPEDVKTAAGLLGYDQEKWDNSKPVHTDRLYWHELTKAQQEAAYLVFVYEEETWDEYVDRFLANLQNPSPAPTPPPTGKPTDSSKDESTAGAGGGKIEESNEPDANVVHQFDPTFKLEVLGGNGKEENNRAEETESETEAPTLDEETDEPIYDANETLAATASPTVATEAPVAATLDPTASPNVSPTFITLPPTSTADPTTTAPDVTGVPTDGNMEATGSPTDDETDAPTLEEETDEPMILNATEAPTLDETIDSTLVDEFDSRAAIGILRQIDSALTYSRQIEPLRRNVPRTHTSFKRLLTKNGPLFKHRLVPTFLKAQLPENPSSLSLLSDPPSASKSAKEPGHATDVPLVFYFVKDLQFFPEDPVQVHRFMKKHANSESGIKSCPILVHNSSGTLSTADLATQLRDQINGDACPLTACELKKDCERLEICNSDEESVGHSYIHISSCNRTCDVVVDVFDDQAFVATVAEDNVQFIGLYKEYNETKENNAVLNADLLSDHILGFPINQPDHPNLEPNVTDWKDLQDKINQTLVDMALSNIIVSMDPLPNETKRLEVVLKYQEAISMDFVGFDASAGLGTLLDVEMDTNHSLDMTADVTLQARFNVLSGNLVSEPIRMLFQPECIGPEVEGTPTCYLEAATFTLIYTREDTKGEWTCEELALLPETDSSNITREQLVSAAEMALNASKLVDISSNIIKSGNQIVVEFQKDISYVEIKVPTSRDDHHDRCTFNEEVVVLKDESCPADDAIGVALNISKAYGIPNDRMASKAEYELRIGKIGLTSTIKTGGDLDLSGNVAGFVETNLELNANISGNLSLQIGSNQDMLSFPDWLGEARAVEDDNSTEGPFFQASSTFNGDFRGEAKGTFNGEDFDTGVSGAFLEPFELNFTSKPPFAVPEIELDLDIPGIGDIIKMSSLDVVKLLLFSSDFLVGADENDSAETCSAGLLATEVIPDKNIFAVQLPILGTSPCQSVGPLQSLTETIQLLGRTYGVLHENNYLGLSKNSTDSKAVDQLSHSTTFQALENQLKTLLVVQFGDSVEIVLNTASNDTYSDLTLDITISMAHTQSSRLAIDLKELLQGRADLAHNITNFLHALSPRYRMEYASEFSFHLGVGLKYDRAAERIHPYIQGTTGLEVSWFQTGETSFDRTSIGPFQGSLDMEFSVGSNENEPLTLTVGLDSNTNYYVDIFDNKEASLNRDDFIYTDMESLLDKVELSSSGILTMDIEMGIPGLVPEVAITIAELNMTIQDLVEFVRNPSEGIDVSIFTNSPGISRLSLFDLLLRDPGALAGQLDDVMQSVEDAAFGSKGVVTTFLVPLLRDGISSALGGNTNNNVLGRARRLIVESFSAALTTQDIASESPDFIAMIADSIDQAVGGLLRRGEKVSSECFSSGFDQQNTGASTDCNGGEASSVVWTIPLGQHLEIELPLDFSFDENFPFHIAIGAENCLSIAWSFDLAFGFDETEGFFLFSGRQDEFKIEALMAIEAQNIDASLLFLSAGIDNLDIMVGAGFFIDIDKSGMLRSLPDQELVGAEDRITIGDVGRAVSPQDFFHIEARVGATLAGEDVTLELAHDGFGDVNDWVPGIHMSLASQFRRSFTNAGEIARRRRRQRRRLQGGPPTFGALGQLHELYGRAEHRAMGLLQSLSYIEDEVGSSHRTLSHSNTGNVSLLDSGFSFPPCPVDLIKENACLRVTNVVLLGEGIKKVITGITGKFVNAKEDGILDRIIGPLVFLDEPIDGLKKVIGSVTVLDIAAGLFDSMGSKKARKAKSGVQSVRKILRMYKDVSDFGKTLNENENVPIAECRDVLNGFKSCTEEDGRLLTGNTNSGRRGKWRNVQFPEGLQFPFLEDPVSVLLLLQGKDIQLLDFTPPELSFSFFFEFPAVIWSPPTVTAYFEFDFEITLKTGFVLDSKGIREAVEQEAPDKALNSLALKDTFDGVDEPLMTLEARIGASLGINLGIELRFGGGLTGRGTIDLYDPNPATSNGLIRPYELFNADDVNPLDWWEISISIFVDFRFEVRLGFFTLYEFNPRFNLFTAVLTPSPPPPCISQDLYSGNLVLNEAYDKFQCTSLSGTGGQEEIECKCNDVGPFKTLDSVKSLLQAPGSKLNELALLGVHSSTNISVSVQRFILDYRSFGNTLLAENALTIAEKEVVMGESRLRFVDVGRGTIKLPQPEMASLTTVVGRNCNSSWELDGHSHLMIKVYELGSSCEIIAHGGSFTDAKITIDFGNDNTTECFDGNTVTLEEGGIGINVTIVRKNSNSSDDDTISTIEIGKAYKHIEVTMTDCRDEMSLNATLETAKSFSVDLGGNDDTFEVGDPSRGLDKISGVLILNGGSGLDKLVVDDSGSNETTKGTLTPATVLHMLREDLDYESFELIDVRLSPVENSFLVTNTPMGSITTIYGGQSNDLIEVLGSQGNLNIYGRNANDKFLIYGLGYNTTCTIYGEEGNDVLLVDGTNEFYIEPVNISLANSSTTEAYRELLAVTNNLDGSIIRWSGGAGNDKAYLNLTSQGNMTLDLFDDLNGANSLTVDCSDLFACSLLFRENFMSSINTNISAALSLDNLSSEKINIDRNESEETESGFQATARVSSMLVRLNSGDNKVWFDDTFSTVDLFGGPNRDEFRFGQHYNGSLFDFVSFPNASLSNSSFANDSFTSDTIQATQTGNGYLSVGNSHPVSVYARSGKNVFNFRRNNAPVLVHGDEGETTGNSVVHGDEGETGNNVYVVQSSLVSVGASRLRLMQLNDAASTDFTLNSLLYFVGGRGLDKLVVVGTESNENYVVSADEVRGGGLSIMHTSLTELDILAQDGDDRMTILSSDSGTRTRLFGGFGENRFRVTPRLPDPVVSKNLRGHRAVLEHYVSSEDQGYLNMLNEGITVDVFDNDGNCGYLYVQDEGEHLMSEEDEYQWNFDFSICPTRQPRGIIVVNVASDVDIEGTRYLSLNDTVDTALHLKFDTLDCQRVNVKYNANALPLENTAKTVFITIDIDYLLTTDLRFGSTKQRISPVSVKLIPGLWNKDAMSVTVVESSDGTTVAEGSNGFNATYDIYLRPCTEEMMNNIVLTIEPDCPDQIFVELAGQNLTEWNRNRTAWNTTATAWNITGEDWQPEEDCKVSLTVAAIDDMLVEGIHFNRLRHTVRNATNGTVVLLPFGSFLDVEDVLVKIYDQESPYLIAQRPSGFLASAELDNLQSNFPVMPHLKEEYIIRLSKQPEAEVNVTVQSFPTASDYFANSTSLRMEKDFTHRSQAVFPATGDDKARTAKDGAENLTFVFTPENWFEWQTVRVAAKNDKVEEGVDFYSWASLYEPPRGKGKGKGGGSNSRSRSLYTNRYVNYGYCSNNNKNRRLKERGEQKKRHLRKLARSELKMSNGGELLHAGGDTKNLRRAPRVGLAPSPSRKWKRKNARATKLDQKYGQDRKGASSGRRTKRRARILQDEEELGEQYTATEAELEEGYDFSEGRREDDEDEEGVWFWSDSYIAGNPLLGGPVEISENGEGDEMPELEDDEFLLIPGALYLG